MEPQSSSEERALARELADAVRHGRDQIDELLTQGASPYVNPTGVTSRVRFRERIPETPLEWSALRARIDLLERFLALPGELSEQRVEKLLGMAAFGRSIEALELIYARFGEGLDLSRAFAYCINQGFVDGAVFLFKSGALKMCERWIEESSKYERILLRYARLNGPPAFDAGDDFFAYLYPLAGIDAVLNSRGVPLANTEKRCRALAALARFGMLTPPMYRQYAERAILFDRCELLPFLDGISGCDALETFGSLPFSYKRLWVQPGISADKVEFVARAMGSDYRYTISASMLMNRSSVQALVAHSDAEHVLHPALLVRYLIDMRLDDELAQVIDWGGVTAENIEEHLTFAAESGNTRAVALLMEYRNEYFDDTDPFDGLEIDSL